MPNTGERREIKRYADAKESQTVEETKKLVSKTKRRSRNSADEELARDLRNVPSKLVQPITETKAPPSDQEAANRMVDEGDPNGRP